jgi:TolB-like protein
MIDKEGSVKIMDLGISRLFRAKGVIRSGAGRPQYMSPEQIEGQEADARSDIFAVGAIIYEMLTGSLPPVGQTARSPEELSPGIPRELSLLVLRCIDQEKEKRYSTAQEIQAELEVIETIARKPPAAHRPPEKAVEPGPAAEPAPAPAAVEERAPRPTVPGKKAPSPRLLPWRARPVVLGLVLLGVIVLAVISWRFIFKPAKAGPQVAAAPPRLSLAVLPFEDLSPAKERQYLGAALAETLIRTLGKTDGLYLPAAASSVLFQGQNHEGRLIGSRLRVDHYLEGTFEVRGEKFKIDARLLRTDAAAALWSGQYERPTDQFFTVQEEIAKAVGNSLGASGAPASPGSLSPASPASFEAYDEQAQARFLLNRGGKGNLEKAIDLFGAVAAKSPTFALAPGQGFMRPQPSSAAGRGLPDQESSP